MKYIDKNKNLKKLQNIELEILKYFDEFCHKNHLEYFLAYGTLLGAVRHKGFIPWDDDIDLHMKGKDYLKLVELLKNNKNKKYFFQSLETEKNYYLLWNKIRLNNTILIEKGWENLNIHKGISIDIFPVFICPDDISLRKKFDRKFKITKLLIENNTNPNKFLNTYGQSGKILSRILKLIPQKIRNNIVLKNIKYFALYEGEGEYCFSTTWGLQKIVKKDIFDKTVKLEFEKNMFDCPKKYDEYLTKIYDNYMELPKKEERIGHGEVYLCLNTKDDTNE